MNILELLTQGDQSQLVSQVAKNFGVSQSQIQQVMQFVLPALTSGMKQNTAKAANQEKFIEALQKGNHARYLESPEAITQNETIRDGNKILGHVFGSKETSRAVAERAAKETGADSSMIKQMLPMLAAAAMGALNKQSMQGANLSNLSSADEGTGSIMSVVQSVLDADNDGSIVDDLFEAASGFMDK